MTGEVAAAVLRVDKPEGPTSHDVVAATRRALDTRRVGHTGTLDPFASGLLLVCIGRATRLAEYLTRLPKTYRGVLRFGIVTDTDDRTGRVIETSNGWRELTARRVEAALKTQVGDLEQVPPAFSAKKVRGERMHRRARRGETVTLTPVRVSVHRITPVRIELPEVTFDVECSSGTYIRAIARDVGRVTGAGAHLAVLRRTGIGRHRVEDAVPMNRLEAASAVMTASMSPLDALAHLPRITLTDRDARIVGHGHQVRVPAGQPQASPETGLVALVHNDALLAVADVDGDRVRPRKVFARA